MTGPILILSQQPIVAALVGMLVELRGYTPVYPETGEEPTEAVMRVRPIVVVLIESELDACRSDLFFAAAARRGAGVAVFGASTRARQIAEIASDRKIPWFTLPPTVEQMFGAIDAAGGRSRERRVTPQATEAVRVGEGTSILSDSAGRRWIVYDRRGGENRQQGERPSSFDRVFVSEGGEIRHLAIGDSETAPWSAMELERQLERATR